MLTIRKTLVVLAAVALSASAAQADLVAYWTFNEGAGTTVTDQINGNVGTLQNDAGFSLSTPSGSGSSLALDGNDFVNVPDSASVSPTGNITLSAWINAPSFSGAPRNILAKDGNNAYRWRAESSGELWALVNDGGGLQTYSSGVTASTGAWHHTAVSVDFTDDKVRFYLDGDLVSTKTTTKTGIADTGGALLIGAYTSGGGEGFNGNLDEVAIWNEALSDGQIFGLALGYRADRVREIEIFNSGVDDSGNVLTPGSADPHYLLTTSPHTTPPPPDIAATVIQNHTAWMGNGPDSSWIGPHNPGQDDVAAGTYIYETTFDLTGLIPDTAVLKFSMAVDNNVTDVLLNGVSTGITTGGFGGLNGPFTIEDHFISGLNTLEFVTLNAGSTPNPGGFRVEILGTAMVVPEPSTFLIWALGLLGLAWYARRRRTK